jgi:hypothetical protein
MERRARRGVRLGSIANQAHIHNLRDLLDDRLSGGARLFLLIAHADFLLNPVHPHMQISLRLPFACAFIPWPQPHIGSVVYARQPQWEQGPCGFSFVCQCSLFPGFEHRSARKALRNAGVH